MLDGKRLIHSFIYNLVTVQVSKSYALVELIKDPECRDDDSIIILPASYRTRDPELDLTMAKQRSTNVIDLVLLSTPHLSVWKKTTVVMYVLRPSAS